MLSHATFVPREAVGPPGPNLAVSVSALPRTQLQNVCPPWQTQTEKSRSFPVVFESWGCIHVTYSRIFSATGEGGGTAREMLAPAFAALRPWGWLFPNPQGPCWPVIQCVGDS